MKRRGFLKALVAAPVAALPIPAIAPKLPDLSRYTHTTQALGFAIDEDIVLESHRVLTTAEIEASMRAALELAFSSAYEDHAGEWAQIFDDHAIDSEALEDIEIGLEPL